MPAVTRTTRDGWIDAGLAALAAGGPDAVRIEPLSASLGVTKGGFYRHFRDRDQFLDELLEVWERRSVDEVLTKMGDTKGDAATNICRAGALTFAADLLAVELAVRSWAQISSEVAARLRRVDNHRMDYLRSQFARLTTDPGEIEARSTLAFAFAIGQHFLDCDHGPFTRTEAIARSAALIVRSPL